MTAVIYVLRNDLVWNSRQSMPMVVWRAFCFLKLLRRQRLRLILYREFSKCPQEPQTYTKASRSLICLRESKIHTHGSIDEISTCEVVTPYSIDSIKIVFEK